MKILLLHLVCIASISLNSCLVSKDSQSEGTDKEKKESSKKKQKSKKVLLELYKHYRDGEISECTLKGETVYCAGINAHDAGAIIYDINGVEIGSCNYAWGMPDSICLQLEDCEVIYCVGNNIWGEPKVDKYSLRLKNLFKIKN